jgi:hypothetical protein
VNMTKEQALAAAEEGKRLSRPWHAVRLTHDRNIELVCTKCPGSAHQVQIGNDDEALHAALLTYMKEHAHDPVPAVPE